MFGSNDSLPFEPTRPWRRAVRRLRNVAIIALMLAALVDVAGLPYLRITYRYRGSHRAPTILSATYWSVTGPLEVRSGELGPGCPPLVMLPLDVPLHRRVRNFFFPTAQPEYQP